MTNEGHELSRFKLLNHVRSVERIAGGESILAIPPVTVEIDPSNACNSACWWCSTADTRVRIHASLERERALRLLGELKEYGVQSVVFKGGGDPSMVPWIHEAVQVAGELQLAVGMNTNGARLTAQLRRELVARGSWVRFSVDASNAETYLKVHQRKEWGKVVRNIKALVDDRNAAGSSLYIGMNCNLDEFNVDEVPEFVALGEELGVDYVAVRPTYWNIAPTGVKHADIRDRVRAALVLAEEMAQTSRRVKIQTGNIRNAIGHGIDDPGACLAPTMMGVVCADGSVAACCDLRGHAQYSFGNIYDLSFKEIWEGERRASVVLQHTALRECDAFCSHAYAYYNQAIDYLRSARPQREFL